MNTAQKILDKAKEEGKKISGGANYLQLMKKVDGKGTKSTGPHELVWKRDEVKMGEDYHTKEKRQELHVYVEENGVEKLWKVPVFRKDSETKKYTDEISYLIPKLAEFKEGDRLIAEAKKSGTKNFIEITKVGEEEDTIQLDEHGGENTESIQGEDDFSHDDNPF